MINETGVKSVILDKLSLYYMGLRPIFNEIAILESMVQNSTVSFQWINIHSSLVDNWRYADIPDIVGLLHQYV